MLKSFTPYLKTRSMILLHLYSHDDFDYPGRIAEELELSPMTVLRHLSKLNEEGMIKVIGTQRRKLYKISEQGVSEIENFLKLLDKFYKSFKK